MIGEVRLHGAGPCAIAALHGGPGAPGSAAALAEGLADRGLCVAEPWQAAMTLDGLVEELLCQLQQTCVFPVSLVGHSWGAWLALYAAAAQPALFRQLILIGCPPLEASYVPLIGQRRLQNLSPEEGEEYKAVLRDLANPSFPDRSARLARLGALAEKADSYCPILAEEPSPPVNGAQYAAVWEEGAARRSDGRLLQAVEKITCPLTLLHGSSDPSPLEGVTQPLQRLGKPFTAIELAACGHTPWIERHASQAFYDALCALLR